MKSIFKVYEHYYKKSWMIILFYIAATVANKIISLITPVNTKNLVDSAVYSGDVNVFMQYAFIGLLLTIMFIIVLSIRYYIQKKIENEATSYQRERIITTIPKLDFIKIHEKPIGYYIQLINSDVETSKGLVVYDFTVFATNVLYSATMIIYMISLELRLSLIVLCAIPLFVVFTKILIPKLEDNSEQIIKASENINNTIDETISGSQTIKLFNAHQYISKRIATLFVKFTNLKMRYTKLDILYDFVFVTGLLNMGNILIYCIGGYMVIKGETTIGTITAFAIYFSSLWNCTESFMSFFKEYKVKMISINRIIDFFNIKSEAEQIDNVKLDKLTNLELSNITFSYGDNDSSIIKDCNLIINEGEKILVAGDNGSGKSTICKIMVKLIQPDSGFIKYNSTNYVDIANEQIRNHISLIEAEPFIFSGNIENNLFGGRIEQSLLKQIDSYSDIARAGNNLSSGEKKLLQLARALALDCDLYIFDEPLNFVDEQAKNNIIEFIENKFKDKTILIVSHDPNAWQFCNKSYRIENKKLVRLS